ncbi:MAG: 2OG-Fe(II) oxygenase [Pseudomonadales bacterium]|nr:2OG-Fe(II) oxygenase [Pseudomonadales bacterium]
MSGLKTCSSESIESALDLQSFAILNEILDAQACEELIALYDGPQNTFRSRIEMARHNFGKGEYKYFSYPLPELVRSLREDCYELLAPVANKWQTRLGIEQQWPDSLSELLEHCHEHGQLRPTPLMLKYGPGDFNCLHQDLYGPIHFPLQVVFLLSQPGDDFTGGELMLVEQRPRMQSRGSVVSLRKGDAVVIPVRERPRLGTRGYHRAGVRHGVSEINSGRRYTMGLIFHDAQ